MTPGELEQAVARLCAPAGGVTPTVRHRATASAGATRSTHFVDIDGTPAVVQLRHRESALQTMSSATERVVVGAAMDAGVPGAATIASGWMAEIEADAIVSEFLAGETIPRRVLRLAPPDTPLAETLTADCGRSLAALHRVGEAELEIVDELPRHTESSYLEHLHDLLDELPSAHPALRYGLVVLATDLPDPQPKRLVHGDFRNGNLLVDGSGLAAVLDWELAHLGNPMEDLAWLCLRTWRFGHESHPVGGFGDLGHLRAAYEAAGGTWDAEGFRWWTIARTIWWGAGLATQAASFERGESDSLVHAASGRRVVELEYDLLNLLGDDHGS